jgi:Brp/Blh family beta-carotene 15,15'-monooxygenase
MSLVAQTIPSHDRFAIAGAILCVAAYFIFPVSPSNLWLLPVTALIGLPHGSADILLALKALLTEGKSPRLFVAYLLVYCLLVAGVWIAWSMFPLPCTVVFFLLAWLHFAGFDEAVSDRKYRVRFWPALNALIVLALPLLRTNGDAWPILSLLAGAPPEIVRRWFIGLALVATAVFPLVVKRPARGTPADYASATLLFVTGVLLPSVYSFAIYFLLWHSPEQMRNSGANSLNCREWIAILVVSLSTIAAGAVIALSISEEYERALNRTFFIGLAALTVPHFINQMIVSTLARFCRPELLRHFRVRVS